MATENPMGAEAVTGPPQEPAKPAANAKAGKGGKSARRADAAAAAAAPAPPATPLPSPFALPPQGEGAPRRPFSTGSPSSEERLNVAVRVLRDPVARTSFSRPYSGQSRSWGR